MLLQHQHQQAIKRLQTGLRNNIKRYTHIATTSIALFKEMLFLFYLIAMCRLNNLKNCVQVILKPSQEGKQSLSMVSRGVANAVSELVQSAEAIKGKHDIFVHFLFLFIQLFKGYI